MKTLDGPKETVAAILVEQRKPLVVDTVELPRSLACGQVLVRVFYSGICGSQIGEIEGIKGPDPHLPHLLGHEGSGRVLQAGPGVKSVRPGDHVVLHWVKGEGIDSDAPVYSWRGRSLNAGWVTTFNEFAVVSENRMTPIPAGVDARSAALLGCAVSTGLGVLSRKAALTMGESIVVFGTGGVGLSVVHGASLLSACPVVGVDIHESRLELAKRMGATHTVLAGLESSKRSIMDVTGARGADVTVETTGLADSIRMAYEIAGPKGRTILVGVPKQNAGICMPTLPLHFGKRLTGTRGGETVPADDIPRYLKMLDAGLLDLSTMVTDEFSLGDINHAVGMIREGRVAGKAVISFSGDHDG